VESASSYQRQYREKHPALVERNRQAQYIRDQKRRLAVLDKNNLAFAKLLIFRVIPTHPAPVVVS
jgi:hypothetical protein